MDVKQKFIELTTQTYPHGHEEELFHLLPSFLKKDKFGNLYHQIGENPSTMFTSHLDTASHQKTSIKHIIKNNIISSDGTTILGADDKAGVVVLLYLIENNIPGLYYFFVGEERGCIGSRKVSSISKNEPNSYINKVISFDRRGMSSVITHQLGGRCCSNEFGYLLSDLLNSESKKISDKPFNYQIDPTGIYTDSAQFTDIYEECTNISVGYDFEHTHSECQDIDHLEKLCKTVINIDWNNLPTYRNPNKKWDSDVDDDYLDYGFGYDYKSYNSTGKSKSTIEDTCIQNLTIIDAEFDNHPTKISINYNTFEINRVELSDGRIKKEAKKIQNLLESLEIDYDDLVWNGNQLTINRNGDKPIHLTRQEICEYVSTLNNWIETEIKYNISIS